MLTSLTSHRSFRSRCLNTLRRIELPNSEVRDLGQTNDWVEQRKWFRKMKPGSQTTRRITLRDILGSMISENPAICDDKQALKEIADEHPQESLMLNLKFFIAKFVAFAITISSFVGSTYWVCDRIVGGADPIMHPFIYMGPIALLIGGGAGAFAVMVITAQEQRSNRTASDSQSKRVSEPRQVRDITPE